MPGLLTSKVSVYECSFEPYSSSLQNEQNPSSNRVSQKYNTLKDDGWRTLPSVAFQLTEKNEKMNLAGGASQFSRIHDSHPAIRFPPTRYWSTFLSLVCRRLHTFLLLLAQIFFQEMCRTDAIVVTSLRGCCMNLSVCWGHSSASNSQSWPIESHLPFCRKARISQTTFLATFS